MHRFRLLNKKYTGRIDDVGGDVLSGPLGRDDDGSDDVLEDSRELVFDQ